MVGINCLLISDKWFVHTALNTVLSLKVGEMNTGITKYSQHFGGDTNYQYVSACSK